MRRVLLATASVVLAFAGTMSFSCWYDVPDTTTLQPDADAMPQIDAGVDAPTIDAPEEPAPPCDPTKPLGTPQPIDELETSFDETGLRLLPGGLMGLFSSNRDGAFKLFFVTRPDAGSPFQIIGPIPPLVGTYNADPTLTADGQTLYFTSGNGSDLFVAHLTPDGGGWGNPANLSATNSGGNDDYPYVRPDGKLLYFASDRSTVSQDLYYAHVNDAGVGAAVPLTELNTPAHEISPAITPDDLTLYFARDVSGYDIFVATRAVTTDPFGAPTALTALNSAQWDVPVFVTADNCTLYIASTRTGGYGGYDLYVSTRPK